MIRLFRPEEELPPDDPRLVEAVERGDAQAVRELLAAGAPVESTHATGHSSLMIAASNGHRQIFELLLDAGADAYLPYAGVGGSALDFAAMSGHSEIIDAWIARGLDVNLADQVGNTPLMAAAAAGHVETVRRLMDAGADVNARTVDGITAYSVALHGKHHNVVALLKGAGARFDPDDPLMSELVSFESAEESAFQEFAAQLTEELGREPTPWDEHADVYAFQEVQVESAPWDELHEEALRRGFYLVHAAHDWSSGLGTLLLFPTKDKYAVIKACGTDGGTCELSTQKIVAWLQKLDKKQPFVLMGCGHDFLTGRFVDKPRNTLQLANSIYRFCPDVVEQGVGTVGRLAYELARTQRFVLWWD